MSDANISIRVDMGGSEWSFDGRRELGIGSAFVFLLHNEDFVTDFVVMCNACLILLFIVGNGLVVVLQFQKLPVHLYLLSENHVHAKRKLTGIVG